MEMNEILISFEIVSKTSTLDKSIFSKEGVTYIYIYIMIQVYNFLFQVSSYLDPIDQ